MRALLADVGGTNARFRLRDRDGDREATLSSASFSTLAAAIESFLSGAQVERMVLALAGPVSAGVCRATNLPWVVSEEELALRFGVEVTLLNDFEAAAYGASAVSRSDLVSLRAGERTGGPVLVIGAGTGLGAAFLIDGVAYPSEAGHRSFAARTDEERMVERSIAKEKAGRLTVEDVISGSGFAATYRALCGTETVDPAEVTRLAIAGDERALHAVDVFCEAYGATVSDMALSLVPTGGVLLCGGLAPRFFVGELRARACTSFFRGFDDKEPMVDLVRALDVALANQDDLGLLGAARFLELDVVIEAGRR